MPLFHQYVEICVSIALHARKESPITGATLEKTYQLQTRKTEAIIRKLVHGNILQSVRGHYGGYYIEKVNTVTLELSLIHI